MNAILGARVGFTGTQEGMTLQQQKAVAGLLTSLIVREAHHGDCIGADEEFHLIVRRVRPKAKIIIHPPVVDVKRAYCPGDSVLAPKDYMSRNEAIAMLASFMIATPKEYREQLRSGTWATVRRARKFEKPLAIVLPNGSILTERLPNLSANASRLQ